MAEMKIACMQLGMLGTNVYLAWNEDTKQGWVVDPADEPQRIAAELEKEGITAKAILLTHGHFDHISGAAELKNMLKVPIYAMEAEAALLKDPKQNMSYRYGTPVSLEADILLTDGRVFDLGGISIKAFHTPGHTGGGCCYYAENHGVLFAGDTLFRCSVGRSDLPTGDGEVLCTSIQNKLMPLPDETIVLPGHGGSTSIGYERSHNPYIR